MLANNMLALVQTLLPGGTRQGAEWKCGSVAGEPGQSMAIHLHGEKAGKWGDFSTGETGDALDLVAAVMTRGDLKEAYRWAVNYLGLHDMGRVEEHRREIARQVDAHPDETDEKRRRHARAMWLGARHDIIGTPVDLYLAARGIHLADLASVPRALRFAPEHYCHEIRGPLPAMLAAITDGSGAHIATHQTWLAQDGQGAWRKAALNAAKKIRGAFLGGSIRLQRGASGKSLKDSPAGETVAIGEGIETCLSVALACPEMRVLAAASLGNMASVQLPDQVRSVILLADNDTNPQAQRGLRRAIDFHLEAGREVRVARSPKGKDFNDAIT
nr:toprim domain-containing protein [Komagataeibacter sp. FNDCR2]